MADEVCLRDAQTHEAPLILDVWRAAYNEDDLHGELPDVQRVIVDHTRSRLLVAEAGARFSAHSLSRSMAGVETCTEWLSCRRINEGELP